MPGAGSEMAAGVAAHPAGAGPPHFAIAAHALGISAVFRYMMPPIRVGEINLPQSASYMIGLVETGPQHDKNLIPRLAVAESFICRGLIYQALRAQ